jgi:hypothetical protein
MIFNLLFKGKHKADPSPATARSPVGHNQSCIPLPSHNNRVLRRGW